MGIVSCLYHDLTSQTFVAILTSFLGDNVGPLIVSVKKD
jgi:hypothetical protein